MFCANTIIPGAVLVWIEQILLEMDGRLGLRGEPISF